MKMKAIRYRGLFYLMILVLLGNLSSLTGLIIHPDIHYFGVEHFIVGVATCLFTLPIFVVLELYLRKNQEIKVEKKISYQRIDFYGWQLAGIWTIIVFATLAWNITLHKQRTTKIALSEAATVFDENLIIYNWAKSRQGVFVPINEDVQPSPHLLDIAAHRATTGSGQPLTLINPECLIRQIYEMRPDGPGPYSHLTSLDPLRPQNSPDPWEAEALKKFEEGVEQLHTVAEIDGEKYMRLMRPIPTEPGCLECHPPSAGSGNSAIRGGISISIPMGPLFDMSKQDIFIFLIAYGTLWFLGMIGTFLGVNRLSESIRAREQTEVRVQSIIDNMFEGLITLNEKWRIESCNPAASRMFGYSRVEMLGRHIGALVKDTTEDQRPVAVEQVETPLLVKKAMGAPIEMTGKRKDGSYFTLEISLSEIIRGQRHLFTAMVRDITERKIAQEALLESQSRIIKQEKLASLGAMVAGIAHEVNNPSQAISFSMDGLKMNMEYVKKLITELKRYLETESPGLAEERERIRRLMNELDMDLVLEEIDDIASRNIKSVERIDHIVRSTKRMAHSEEVFSPCDLNTIVSDAVVLTHNQVKYDLEIVMDLAPHLPPFQGLAQEMGQVFMNLIINARDAVREKNLSKKQGRIDISTCYNMKAKCLEARFADNGIGIKKENINKVFDPFFTTKKVGSGTGLGLNLCHRIIDSHGGQINVESEPGKGTCFTVRLFV
ncbi:MAG: ATP-binding protein [Desulfobulbaceae bacterium]|nr:ATP-binding protein [Desulfobulbaceae bacterium]